MSRICYNAKLAAFPKENLEVYAVFEEVTEKLEGEMLTAPDIVGYMVIKDEMHEEVANEWIAKNLSVDNLLANTFSITTIGDVSFEEAMPWAEHVESDPYYTRDGVYFGHIKHIQKKIDRPFVPGQSQSDLYGPLIDLLIGLAGYPRFDWDYATLNNMFQY